MIESNKSLEVIDDEEAIKLLINIKYTVIVADPIKPIQNTLHTTIILLCETIVIGSK